MSDQNKNDKDESKKVPNEGKQNAAGNSEAGDGATGGLEGKVQKVNEQVDFLREYLAQSLGLRDTPEQKLEELTLAGVAKYLASDKCKNVVTMAGAGISTSAGIPDFRSPGTGLYNNLASYDLPHPTAIFELDFFMKNPKPFFVLAKELYPGSFKPTPCHYFLKLLNEKGKLLRHFTQNIDTLERVAGLDSEKIVEAHGTFHTSHCLECGTEYQLDWMKEQIFADKIPKCEQEACNGVVKPDIVFFGESLPRRFADCVESDFSKCDLLIVMGTSLTVQPFATLVSRVPSTTPRLYINLEKGMTFNNPISALFFGGGFNFDGEDNYRDVFKEATCDDGCQELADLLGWGEELKQVVATEHARIDKESGQDKQASAAAATKSSKSPSAQAAKSSPATKTASGSLTPAKPKSGKPNAASEKKGKM